MSNLNALLLKEFQFLQYKKEVNKVGGSSSSVQPYYEKVLDRQTALRAGNQLNHPSPEEVYTKLDFLRTGDTDAPFRVLRRFPSGSRAGNAHGIFGSRTG